MTGAIYDCPVHGPDVAVMGWELVHDAESILPEDGSPICALCFIEKMRKELPTLTER